MRYGVALLLVALALAPRGAAAEWFVDAYAGAAFTEKADFTQKSSDETVSVTFPHARFDTVPSYGIRGGYWFESRPWLGLELDLSHFEPHRQEQDVSALATTIRERDFKVSSLALNLRLRWPLLVSATYPQGQLQPYLALGPAVFVTQTRLPEVQSSDDVVASPGAHAGAGVLWWLHPRVGVFTEYRFTYFHLDFKSGGVLPSETDIRTHHLLGGVSFRF